MKKNELIELLLAHKQIGELSADDLEKMNMKSLEALRKELDAEVSTETPENVPEELPNGTIGEEIKPFTSMCGLSFDPSKSGACFGQCADEFPDSFKDCQNNFSAQPAKAAKAKAAPGLGMNQWYHRPGSQGGELDRFFEEGKVGTVEEIALFANCNTRRVMIHIKHLIADFNVSILKAGRKNEDGTTSTVYFWSEKDKRRKGELIEGKTAFPNGFPKDHPCYGKDIPAEHNRRKEDEGTTAAA